MTPQADGLGLSELSPEQLWHIQLAFKHPRGRYGAERASQLSGVPTRTLHDWARVRVYVPDFNHAYPKMWSYRDLVFVRFFAWLRTKGMDRPQVAARVAKVKRELSENEDAFSTVRSDGVSILRDDELIDETSGQQAFAQVVKYLDAFNLNAPLDVNEFRKGSTLWGPNLVRPSARTAMSPWIMGGDPCIEQTRIPTIGVYELSRERGLDEGAIADLYSIEPGAVSDALSLENRLHQAA